MSKTKQKSLEELLEEALVPEEEQPYEVPGNWVWVRFGTVAKLFNGYAFRSVDYCKEGIPIIRISDLNGVQTTSETAVRVPRELYNEKFLVRKGDLLIAMSGATTGKIGIYNSDEVAMQNQRVGNIRTINDGVLYAGYRNYFVIHSSEEISKLAYGGAQPNISGSLIESLAFPLPPLNEQKRIAQKVERLFAKIDEAKRLIEEVKESFELRRAAILDKAFKGQLGTNDPNEQSMLEASDTIKEKDLIPKEEQPYEVPENWVWVKLESISEYVQRGKSPKYVEKSSVKVVSQKCIQWTGFDISKARFIDENTLPSYKKERFLRKGDLLWNSTGTGTIGRIAKIDNELEGLVVADSHVTVIRPNSIITDSSFLYRWFSSPFVQDQINGLSSGSTNQIELSLSAVKRHPVPFPPLNEQKRIAEKLDNLLNKLENEQELALEVEQKLDLLKQAILSKAFRGELGTNDPTDEHAIELLKEVLKSK